MKKEEVPAITNNRFKVLVGDASTLLPIPAHLIVTDPPYFFKGMGVKWRASEEIKITDKQRVQNLSSGMAFTASQSSEAREGFRPFAKGMFQSLSEGGYVIIFSAPRLVHGFAMSCEDVGFAIRDQLVWQHEGGQYKAASLERFGGPRDRVTPQCRPMFESILVAQKLPTTTLSKCWQTNQTGLMATRTLKGEVPTNILRFAKPERREREEGYKHPTQKPVALLEELIHRFSIQDQTVLDPFVGSGSTGVAAIRQKRNFVGIDLDPYFAEVTRRRLCT